MPRPRLGAEPMTSAQKQARRREQFRQMRDALARIAAAKSVKEARAIAAPFLKEKPEPQSGE